MKLAPLLFLSIYSQRLRTPRFLGPHDTLPCVLILGDETISKHLYNLFQAVQQFHRAPLAGFSETNGVVYAKFHKSNIRITVLYDVLYGSYSTVMQLITTL